MKKKIWITALDKDKDAKTAKKLTETIARYGLAAEGHFWRDDLGKMEWSNAQADLEKGEVALWAILGSSESFAAPSVRKGLALLGLSVAARRGLGFPIVVIPSTGKIDPATLPTPLRGAETLSGDPAALGAKLVAKANLPVAHPSADYRLSVHPFPGLGLWLEVGPAAGQTWAGAMLGVLGGEIVAHGVGPAKKVPERAVLEYPMKGLQIELGADKYTAWAVKNPLPAESSYYVSIKGDPAAILFGAFSEQNDTDVYVVRLA